MSEDNELARAALVLLGRLLQTQDQTSLDAMTNGLSDSMLTSAVDVIKSATTRRHSALPETLYAYASILSPGKPSCGNIHLGNIERDATKAVELNSRAAEEGLPVAALAVACKELPVFNTDAIPWLQVAADAEIPLARSILFDHFLKKDIELVESAWRKGKHDDEVPRETLDRLRDHALGNKDHAAIAAAIHLALFYSHAHDPPNSAEACRFWKRVTEIDPAKFPALGAYSRVMYAFHGLFWGAHDRNDIDRPKAIQIAQDAVQHCFPLHQLAQLSRNDSVFLHMLAMMLATPGPTRDIAKAKAIFHTLAAHPSVRECHKNDAEKALAHLARLDARPSDAPSRPSENLCGTKQKRTEQGDVEATSPSRSKATKIPKCA